MLTIKIKQAQFKGTILTNKIRIHHKLSPKHKHRTSNTWIAPTIIPKYNQIPLMETMQGYQIGKQVQIKIVTKLKFQSKAQDTSRGTWWFTSYPQAST